MNPKFIVFDGKPSVVDILNLISQRNRSYIWVCSNNYTIIDVAIRDYISIETFIAKLKKLLACRGISNISRDTSDGYIQYQFLYNKVHSTQDRFSKYLIISNVNVLSTSSLSKDSSIFYDKQDMEFLPHNLARHAGLTN